MNEAKLKKFVLWFVLGLLALLLLFPPKNKIHRPEAVTYFVGESNELYFKNIRAFHYRKTSPKDWATDVYVYKDQVRDSSKTELHFTLAINWRNDEARLLAQPYGQFLEFDSYTLFSEKGALIEIDRHRSTTEEYYRLGAEILNAKINGDSVWVGVTENLVFNLWEGEGNAQSNQIVLEDYFRLVGRFK